MTVRSKCLALLPLGLVACFPTTTRPPFLPQSSAVITEVQLAIPQATRALALALNADSIPVRRTEPKDGWLESEWFDANTLQPTSARRVGPNVVKIRAWVDPSRPAHSNITLETVYRPMVDPSRGERQLERQVAAAHPVARRMVALGQRMAKEYGGVAEPVVPIKP